MQTPPQDPVTEHDAISLGKFPAPQVVRHAVEPLTRSEKVPAWQVVHKVLKSEEKVPGRHGVHTGEAEIEYPGGHQAPQEPKPG